VDELYKKLLETCAYAGISILNDEHCAKLLAVVYAYATEQITASPKILADVAYAQQEFGLIGGEELDAGKIVLLQRRIDELRKEPRPVWVAEIESRYKIVLSQSMNQILA